MKRRFRGAREGSSLAIVMCVSAFLMAFSLAMLYTASLSLSRSNRRLSQERSYQLARSFSEVLETELKRYLYVNAPGEGDGSSPVPGQIAPSESFYRYVVGFLEGQYGEYDPAHPDETVFHFTVGEVSGDADTEDYGAAVRVALYKEAEDVRLSETLSFGELKTKLDDIETNPLYRYIFTLEVTVETEEGMSYSYRTEYQQVVRYAVEYRCGNVLLVRDDAGDWHEETTVGPLFSGSENTEVRYSYKRGMENIISCTFYNAFQEKGDDG